MYFLRSCTPYPKNTKIRERLLVLINECNDPFARDIRYHKNCWMDNVRTVYNTDPSKNAHIQDVRNEEVVEMFTQHVEQCIIPNKEPRLLIGLLSDYNRFLENFNFENVYIHPQCGRSLKVGSETGLGFT